MLSNFSSEKKKKFWGKASLTIINGIDQKA